MPRKPKATANAVNDMPATADTGKDMELWLREQQEVQTAAAPIVERIRGEAISIHKGELAYTFELNKKIGAIRHGQFMDVANRLAMLKDLYDIKENKVYRNLPVLNTQGELVVTKTWADFCESQGFARETIDRDLRNMRDLGSNFLEIQSRLGLAYSDVHMIRAGLLELEPEQRQKAIEALHSAEGKEEARALLGEMGVLKEQQQKRIEELEATIATKDERIKEAMEARDKADLKLARVTKIKPGEEDRARVIREANARTELANLADGVNNMVLKLCAFARTAFAEGGDELADFIHQRISAMCRTMRVDILNAGIDVDFEAEFIVPELAADETAESPQPDPETAPVEQ